MFAMLYARQYTELDAMIATLPSTNSHRQLAIASATAQHGAPAGIAEAERGNVAQTERNQNLLAAGNFLANLGLYRRSRRRHDRRHAGRHRRSPRSPPRRALQCLKKVSLAPLPQPTPPVPSRSAPSALAGTLTRQQAIDIISRHAYASQQSLERGVDKSSPT